MKSAALWALLQLSSAEDVRRADPPPVVTGPMCTPDDTEDSGNVGPMESTADPNILVEGTESHSDVVKR